ncbi:MAG: 30S ribosomal protein S15 [Candidatus Wallbacteria bacterium]
MSLNREDKHKVIDKYKIHETDTGSVEVQVALLTARISQLSDHFKVHKKDHHSRLGLLKLVGQRKRLINYLKRVNPNKYKELVESLGIRK